MQNSSSEEFSEYLVAYLVRSKSAADHPLTEMWVCFSSDLPLFPAEIIDFLSGVERDRGIKSPQIVLRNIAALHSFHEVAAVNDCSNQPQPQPQSPYWEWCKEQGLPYNQFDVLQSSSVIAQRPSPTAELFVLGQIWASLTFYSDRA